MPSFYPEPCPLARFCPTEHTRQSPVGTLARREENGKGRKQNAEWLGNVPGNEGDVIGNLAVLKIYFLHG
jgi:hypothetical protein